MNIGPATVVQSELREQVQELARSPCSPRQDFKSSLATRKLPM
jgi:hypothetical protein